MPETRNRTAKNALSTRTPAIPAFPQERSGQIIQATNGTISWTAAAANKVFAMPVALNTLLKSEILYFSGTQITGNVANTLSLSSG